MGTKLFVGSLAYSTTDQSLTDAFSQAGSVVSAKVIMDRMTGRSRGFGFVEMASPDEAQRAIEMWNGKTLDGRPVVVNEARPMEQRGGGGAPHRGGRSGGGGGYRGGGRSHDDTGGRDW